MDRKEHWDRVHTTRPETGVSWFESVPQVSLDMLDAAGVTPETCVIDVGGGASHLVDALIRRGLTCLHVLDVSGAVLRRVKQRLGPDAARVSWIEADVAGDWSEPAVDIWHDRAVLHFLVDRQDQARYREHLDRSLRIGGSAIIATFAPDGPDTCSGLPVVRYSSETLASMLGDGFRLVETMAHSHRTPGNARQSFQYSRLVRIH